MCIYAIVYRLTASQNNVNHRSRISQPSLAWPVQFTASPTVKCVQSIRRVFTVCACNVFTVAARRHPVALIRESWKSGMIAMTRKKDERWRQRRKWNWRRRKQRWGNLTISIERVASARIVGVPVNFRNKNVFYDFTDSDRKSEGRWITSENSRLSRDSRSRCETWMGIEIFTAVLCSNSIRIIYMTYRSYSITIEITEKNYVLECKFWEKLKYNFRPSAVYKVLMLCKSLLSYKSFKPLIRSRHRTFHSIDDIGRGW